MIQYERWIEKVGYRNSKYTRNRPMPCTRIIVEQTTSVSMQLLALVSVFSLRWWWRPGQNCCEAHTSGITKFIGHINAYSRGRLWHTRHIGLVFTIYDSGKFIQSSVHVHVPEFQAVQVLLVSIEMTGNLDTVLMNHVSWTTFLQYRTVKTWQYRQDRWVLVCWVITSTTREVKHDVQEFRIRWMYFSWLSTDTSEATVMRMIYTAHLRVDPQ